MIRRTLARLKPGSVTHEPAISKKVFLESGELPGLTNFSQAVFRPGDAVGGHCHEDMWEVFLVRSGRGTIRVDDVESALAEDDCWVVEPGEVHAIRNNGETDLVLLYFGLRAGSEAAYGPARDQPGGRAHEPE
ncbi:MAG: cupin domain-containing protein [Thermoanaerobaculia bacterium]